MLRRIAGSTGRWLSAWCVGMFVGCATTGASDSATARCSTDADCVNSCVQADDCCLNPCGCDQVRHIRHHEAVVEANAKHCANLDADCPDVGACDPSYAYAVPRCRDGQCVGERPPPRTP
jgi:hypothetical protein